MWLLPRTSRRPLAQPLLVTLTGSLCTRLQLGGVYQAVGQLRPVGVGLSMPDDALHAPHQVREEQTWWLLHGDSHSCWLPTSTQRHPKRRMPRHTPPSQPLCSASRHGGQFLQPVFHTLTQALLPGTPCVLLASLLLSAVTTTSTHPLIVHLTTNDALALHRQLAAAGHALDMTVHPASPMLPLNPSLAPGNVVHGNQVADARQGVLLVDAQRFATRAQQAALQQLLDKPAVAPSPCQTCCRGVIWVISDGARACTAAQADLVVLHDGHAGWGAVEGWEPVQSDLQRPLAAARAMDAPSVPPKAQQALQRCYLQLRGWHKVVGITHHGVVCHSSVNTGSPSVGGVPGAATAPPRQRQCPAPTRTHRGGLPRRRHRGVAPGRQPGHPGASVPWTIDTHCRCRLGRRRSGHHRRRAMPSRGTCGQCTMRSLAHAMPRLLKNNVCFTACSYC